MGVRGEDLFVVYFTRGLFWGLFIGWGIVGFVKDKRLWLLVGFRFVINKKFGEYIVFRDQVNVLLNVRVDA